MQPISLSTGATARFFQAVGGGKLPTILMVHGWKSQDPLGEDSTYTQLARELGALGFHSLVLCLRGHGCGATGSLDTVSRNDHLEDIFAALDWLSKNPEVDYDKLCGLGTSYGGYMLAVVSGVAQFKFLLLRAPAQYPDEGLTEPTQAVIDRPDLEKFRSQPRDTIAFRLNGLRHFTGSLMLVASGNDRCIPKAVTDSYYTAAVGKAQSVSRFTLPDAGHKLTEREKAQYLKLVKDFFSGTFMD